MKHTEQNPLHGICWIKYKLVNGSFRSSTGKLLGFSSAYPDGLTPSTWMLASFRSKKAHYELANQGAVFLLVSGEKTPHPQKASCALCKAHKIQHSDSICLYSVAPALFFLTSHLAQISLRAQERDTGLHYQKWKQLRVRDSASLGKEEQSLSPLTGASACFLDLTVALRMLSDNEDVKLSPEGCFILTALTASRENRD